jgi:hypothetical protein
MLTARFGRLFGTAAMAIVYSTLTPLASAEDWQLTVTKPTNQNPTEVTMTIGPLGHPKDKTDVIKVTIPPNTSAEQKRALIKKAMHDKGYSVEDSYLGIGIDISNITKGYQLDFDPGGTGEKEDQLRKIAPKESSPLKGQIRFQNTFTPLAADGLPAVFTAGIVTDLGELTVQVSAQELRFQTDGVTIAQALFDRLAPQAPGHGAQVQQQSDSLVIQFDPNMTQTVAGIAFGTTSLTAGVSGSLASVQSMPIGMTGYNADVISDADPTTRFATPFDANTFAWFELGAVDDNGVQHHDGLPAGLTFTSFTGSGATYQIQPANGLNVLQLGAGQIGTLTLTIPEPYGSLGFLASSGDGSPFSCGNGFINFADGSQQLFCFNVFDWHNGQGNFHPEAALPGPNGRANVGPNGTSFFYVRECDFQVYETVVPIDPWHAGVPILSIDFTGAPDAFYSNIFGVSGK